VLLQEPVQGLAIPLPDPLQQLIAFLIARLRTHGPPQERGKKSQRSQLKPMRRFQ
jgi:hypothetical protein